MENNIKDIRNLCEQNTDNEVEEILNETENMETAEVEETEEDTEGTETETTTKPQEQEKPKVEPLPEQKPFLHPPYERAILEEMERRAADNPALAEGLKDKDKSIGECFAFVTNRAKKMATSNCAMIDDSEVYAWAQFYYTQRREIISLELKPTPKPTTSTTAPKGKTDTKASSKAKKAEKKEDKPKTDTKEQKTPPSKDKVTEVEGKDGKTYTITELGLF